ncbi:RHS repeat domain-containing protein [Cronobacter dublinensis]
MSAKNPTENAISELEISWLERTENSAARVIVWRVPASGESLLNGFFALQQHPEGRSLADLFITLDTPFETGYGYSEALANDFLESVEVTPDARPWTGEAFLPCFSAAALCAMLADFARVHAEDFTTLIVILKPAAVSDITAYQRWLAQWVAVPAERVRLLLTDTTEQPLWQPLIDAHASQVLLLNDTPDAMQVMQQTARQQTDPDSDRLLFRRYLADAMLLLEKGSATQGVRYVFDRAGELRQRRNLHTGEVKEDFLWDENRQLIAVRKGEHQVRYGYDALGRRVFKQTPDETRWFYWQGDALAGETVTRTAASLEPLSLFDTSGRIKREQAQAALFHRMREYVYYPGTFRPLALLTQEGSLRESWHYHCDPNGAPVRLTSVCGEIVWAERTGSWGEKGQVFASRIDNPLRFQGQYFDPETGLHYNRYRYYDPAIAAYISQDPIALWGGYNSYQYSHDPLLWIDPLGLLNEGEVAGYGSKAHVGDGLEAHEIIRNKFLQNIGIGKGRRVKGNPSIALTPRHHDLVHAAENRIRRSMGMGVNEMTRAGKIEIRIMSKAIQQALVDTGIITQEQLRIARRFAKSYAKANGCY